MKKDKPTKKTREERTKQRLERDLDDIRFISKTPQGRRFLWRILTKAQVFSSNAIDNVIPLARIEGRRSVGLEILSDIMSAKPSLFGQMQEEHASEMTREAIEIKQEEKGSDPLSLDY